MAPGWGSTRWVVTTPAPLLCRMWCWPTGCLQLPEQLGVRAQVPLLLEDPQLEEQMAELQAALQRTLGAPGGKRPPQNRGALGAKGRRIAWALLDD